MIILQIFLQSSCIRFIVAKGIGVVPCDQGMNVAPWFGNALEIYVVVPWFENAHVAPWFGKVHWIYVAPWFGNAHWIYVAP